MLRIESVNHISIAVRDLDAAVQRYCGLLGLVEQARETVAERGVRLAKLDAGGVCIELVEPLEEDSPLGRSMKRRGEGLHHLAFTVRDIGRVLERMRAAGVPLVHETPRKGAKGSRIAFLKPEALGGVLVELVEPADPGRATAGADKGESS